MQEIISHNSWMREISDQALLTTLSIPGTHDSCAIDGPLGFAKTQNLDLNQQFDAGVRFLDIRLAHYQDNLFVHHNAVHMEKSYADVLDICSDFLRTHPTETILMSVKEEDRIDGIFGRFAPSEAFGRARRDPANWVIRSNSFEDAFTARTWQHVEHPALFYNFSPPRPENGSVTPDLALTSETTLGEVRGKIVLLRRFDANATKNIGFDFTDWQVNCHFKGGARLVYSVEDCYFNPGEDSKYSCITAHIEEARKGDLGGLYVTFASAVGLKASRYSRIINKYLNVYLAGLSRGRVGIIVLDYFEQPRKLVSNVIKLNEKTYDQRPPRSDPCPDAVC